MTDEELDFLKTALEVNLPMVMQQRNPKRAQCDNEIIASSVFDYPSAVGGLLYLSLTARPDVAQSVRAC